MREQILKFPDFFPNLRLAGPFGRPVPLSSEETNCCLDVTKELVSHMNPKNDLEMRILLKIDVPSTEKEKPVPAEIAVRVGGIQANLAGPKWLKMNGYYVNEVPVSLTALLKSSLKIGRKISMVIVLGVLADKRVSGVAEFFVSRKVTAPMLRKSVIAAGPLPRKFVEDRMSAMQESGVNFEVVSLKCPCLGVRIKTPVRFETCRHAECFDLDFFIKMEEKRPKGRCPVCNRLSELRRLGVCEFTDMLLKTYPDCESYRIHPNGYDVLNAEQAMTMSRKRKRDAVESSISVQVAKAKKEPKIAVQSQSAIIVID